jgi:hypothetical protein
MPESKLFNSYLEIALFAGYYGFEIILDEKVFTAEEFEDAFKDLMEEKPPIRIKLIGDAGAFSRLFDQGYDLI